MNVIYMFVSFVHMREQDSRYVYEYVYMCVHICMYVYAFVCMPMCVYVCMCVCVSEMTTPDAVLGFPFYSV